MSQLTNPSTGPRTDAGKQRSSQNSLKHGLASGRLVVPGEDSAAFESLLADLLAEHQPATPTETLLIHDMAKSYWLKERALRLQAEAFEGPEPDLKKLDLYLRYQTTNERAFHKSLQTLLDLQFQRRRAAPEEFVSQPAEETHPPIQEDTPETLDRDMANIQERLKLFLERNPEAATRAANVPGLDRLLGS